MSSYDNLAGRQIGTLIVANRASLQPLRWQVTCSLCNSSWSELHSVLTQQPRCRNSACGRVVEPSRSAARVDSIPVAVRSRDSADALRFAESQRPREITMPEMAPEQMMKLDPDTLARHLDYLKRRKTNA